VWEVGTGESDVITSEEIELVGWMNGSDCAQDLGFGEVSLVGNDTEGGDNVRMMRSASWLLLKGALHRGSGLLGFIKDAGGLSELDSLHVLEFNEVSTSESKNSGCAVISEFSDFSGGWDVSEVASKVVANGWELVDVHDDLWLSLVGLEHLKWDWLVEEIWAVCLVDSLLNFEV
jgi:hypothetical protein